MQEAGLALSTAICATLQGIWLLAVLARRIGGLQLANLMVAGLRTIGLVIVMSAACLGVQYALQPLELWALWQVLLITGVGLGVFIGLSLLLRVPEAISLIWHSREDQITPGI
jgi:hypothetical protein